MATNLITNVENQKSKLHLILLSKVQGYTNVAHILKDLKDEFNIDGLRLANACGQRSFATFLTSPCMQKYCRAKDDEQTTTYYGIPDARTLHIKTACRSSLERCRTVKTTLARFYFAIIPPQWLTKEELAKIEEAAVQLNICSRRFADFRWMKICLPVMKAVDYLMTHHNTLLSETQTQETDPRELAEKAVQTKAPAQETLVTLKIKRRHAHNLKLMNVKVECDENMQVKEFVRKIVSGYPSVGECEVKSLRYYDPTYECDIDVARGECIVPKRKYILVLADRRLCCADYVMFLIVSFFVAMISYIVYNIWK
ncbi:hypothetical protein DdX_09130 [Ditylenchus destructor]|uniref:DUF7515 domain-containing protein n=1 Tax=Ditylenchus destructor TaxID=166010 RepID=A0AAD4R078_9BILA|nr:hypothetical protein DdX_09130 [Ditylenchus destructor]